MNDPEIAKLIHPPQVENTSDASLSGAKSKKWQVIVIPKGTTHEFWKTLHAGALKAAERAGERRGDLAGAAEGRRSRAQQIQLVQNAIAAGVDGIVLAPLDARALVEPVEAAIAKGIPVVIFDSALEIDQDRQLRRDRQLPRRRAGGPAAGRAARRARDRSSCCATRSARRAPSSARRASPTPSPRSSPGSR